ncbi:MAG: CHAT domain-containing protein [Thermoanaerobaculia bacterium]|nr:CHAT domain-containing protein [Thermoanaerobaculia bacterium]
MGIWLFLALLAVPGDHEAPTGPPTFDQLQLAAQDPEQLTSWLARWLDAYPSSAEGWSADELGIAVAHLVGRDQCHLPNAAEAAEAYARIRVETHPLRLAKAAEALSLAAVVRLRRGEDVAARALADEGTALCSRGVGSEQEATACAFVSRNRAILDMRLGRFEAASEVLDLAQSWLEPYPTSPAWVVILNSSADVACARAEVVACIERYERATRVSEALHGVDSELSAYGYLGIGLATALAGDWGKARASFERAEQIWTRRLGPQHPRLADALVDYGGLLHRAGDSQGAANVLRRAVDLREARLGAMAFDLPRALDGLGAALIDLGDLSEAGRVLERAAEIRRQQLPDDHLEHADSWLAQADLDMASGHERSARRLLSKALDRQRQALGPGDPRTAETALRLADLLVESEPQRAVLLASTARDTLALNYGEDHPNVAHCWWLEARGRLASDNDPIPSALRAEDIGRRHLRRIAVGLAEQDLLDYAQVRPNAIDVALEGLLRTEASRQSRIRAVWQAIAHSRALVFDTLVARRRAELPRAADTELSVARQALARAMVTHPGDDPTTYSRTLQAARERVAKAERSLSIHTDPQLGQPVRWDRILGSLDAGTTLLAYRIYSSTTGPRLSAFAAVGGADRVTALDLGPWPQIRRDLEAWRAAFVGSSEQEYRRIATAVRQQIWDPVESSLGRPQRLFIVPDGDLFLLSFGALPTDDGYLIEQPASLHVLGAERDLIESRNWDLTEGRVLVVGDPDFDRRPEPAVARSTESLGDPLHHGPESTPRFAALPESREEARTVERAWHRWAPAVAVERLEGSAASEESWRRRAPGAVALHLATHGFSLLPGARATLPSFPGGEMPSDLRAVGGLAAADPRQEMSVSGFALAGANRPSFGDGSRDGIVTSEEIQLLDLSAARWVVLSFCDSGLGETLSGEGVFGFTRAFRRAGARALALTLAPVSDRDSRQLMELFYQAVLGEGQPPDMAVRQASLALLTERRREGLSTHPFHWGALISSGLVMEPRTGAKTTGRDVPP